MSSTLAKRRVGAASVSSIWRSKTEKIASMISSLLTSMISSLL